MMVRLQQRQRWRQRRHAAAAAAAAAASAEGVEGATDSVEGEDVSNGDGGGGVVVVVAAAVLSKQLPLITQKPILSGNHGTKRMAAAGAGYGGGV